MTRLDDSPEVMAPAGLTWEEMTVGSKLRTASRTVTETDLINFVTQVGFTEPLFTDHQHAAKAGYEGRLIPGALTFCLAEGLVMQTNFLNGTGLAFVHMELDALGPVYVGDTIHCFAEITESRPTSRNRGVVTSRNVVINQRNEEVLIYTPVRIIRGRSTSSDASS